ncbi:MAG: OFA family MFS transporter [Opitutales bacterium]|nr:OFA family MFS transporter [Opitutales bacterium]
MSAQPNRWTIAAAAVGVHISIGSIYAYSVFNRPLQERLGWDPTDSAWAFSIAILFLGLAASFLGPTVERLGPRKSGFLSASLFTLGLLVSALAVHLGWLPLFYLGFGVIGGTGIGVGYICPVSTLVKWFPDRRGLATGLAIMGFGFGSLVAGSLIQFLITHTGLTLTFLSLAALYGTVMVLSASRLRPPPVGWMAEEVAAKKAKGGRGDLSDINSFEALKTVRFYFLWIMLFINVTCGIAIISVASPMAQEIAGLTPAAAAAMVGLMGLFNGIGRLGWASFSDIIGRPLTYTAFFFIQIIAFLALPSITHAIAFQMVIFLILTCYGGGFASIPAYIGDLFGTRSLASIHGNVLTAWAAAGLAGPLIAARVRETTGSYNGMLTVFAVFFLVALICSILIQFDIRRVRRMTESRACCLAPGTR